MTTERRTQDIGHCRNCKGQWVVKHNVKGKRTGTVNGQVCPFCRSERVYYKTEDNR